MRVRAWVVSLSAVSILTLGALGMGCGSVTPVEEDAGASGGNPPGGKGGTVAGGSGGAGAKPAGAGGATAGSSGGVDSIGTAGVTGRGADGGFSGGGSGGSGGVVTSGRGGVDGGGGKGGTGGVGSGGRGGGSAGATGAGGRGGTTGAGGALVGAGGIGGFATGGRGGGSGGAAGNGGSGGTMCARGACPALTIADLEGIDHSKAPGFDAPGLRCKSMTVCPPSGSCIYFSTTMWGSVQSAEDTYTDGAKQTTPMAVHVVIDGGAASQCGNPAITFTADEYFMLTFDGGKKVPVYLPATTAASFTLYLANDGSTYYDAALTNPARLRP